MSGHSKWSTIKRAKGVADAKKGAIFTRLAKVITIAVRQNKGVGLAVERAKAANMPKENIQRAIDRGKGKLDGSQLFEAIYEGFGPGGAAIIIETISDNNARTAAEIRNTFSKHGGKLAASGSAGYLFTRTETGEFQPIKEMMVKADVADLLNALNDLDDVQNVYTNTTGGI